MLKPAAHQVAGHQAGVGVVGPLVDGAGKFYKPLQDGDRGAREKKFYEQFWADQDMGVHTWHPGASDQYVAKCMKKDAETTSKELGFRVSGLQVFDGTNGKTWKPGHVWCKMLGVDATKTLFKQFVSLNPTDDINPDSVYASALYNSSDGIINQLNELKSWFAVQTNYHFFSSSILLMYESDCTSLSTQENMCGTVKLVDFAHVLTRQGAVDDNFLQGLDSLISILRGIAG